MLVFFFFLHKDQSNENAEIIFKSNLSHSKYIKNKVRKYPGTKHVRTSLRRFQTIFRPRQTAV